MFLKRTYGPSRLQNAVGLHHSLPTRSLSYNAIHSLFQSHCSSEGNLVLPLSISTILVFSWGHWVAAYVFFLFLSFLSFLKKCFREQLLWDIWPVYSTFLHLLWKNLFHKFKYSFLCARDKCVYNTGCFKKSFTTLKAYRNLYRGHTQGFELSKCSKTHQVLPRIVMVQCDFHW